MSGGWLRTRSARIAARENFLPPSLICGQALSATWLICESVRRMDFFARHLSDLAASASSSSKRTPPQA
jgi:hypothetical protein